MTKPSLYYGTVTPTPRAACKVVYMERTKEQSRAILKRRIKDGAINMFGIFMLSVCVSTVIYSFMELFVAILNR